MRSALIALAVLVSAACGIYYVLTIPGAHTSVEFPLERTELAPIELTDRQIDLGDGGTATVRLPKEFSATVAATGLGKARFMMMSPDGRLFVPDMVDYNLSHEGKVYVLGGFDPETGTFSEKHVYLSGLRGPNDLLFYRDREGQDWLYVALTEHLVRYPYEAGDLAPSGPSEIVVEFPNEQSPGEASVVWHITRSLSFHDGRIYIAVGSGCNACEQLAGDMRGMVYSVLPDGSDPQVYADRIRNGVGLTWAGDTLYATANGVDHLGPDMPDEMLYRLEEGMELGWPYCYEQDGEVLPDTSRVWNGEFSCDEVPRSFTAFPPRSAPLGIEYFEDAHPVLEGAFLVALHGSFDVALMSGNQVIRVAEDGTQEVFMDGFFDEAGTRIIRIVDFLEYDRNSFFMSDDEGGRILFLRATM